jgi:rubredoxin
MARLKVIAFTCAVLLLLPILALAQTWDSRPWDNSVLCPKCKSDRVVYILYGEPILDDDLKRAIESHKVELAGCIVTQDSHRWECRNCGHKWGQVQPQKQ